MEQEVPGEAASGARGEAWRQDACEPKGRVTVAFLDGTDGVDDGDRVEVVHQAPQGFVDRTAAGGAVASQKLIAMTFASAPVIHSLGIAGGVETFFDFVDA